MPAQRKHLEVTCRKVGGQRVRGLEQAELGLRRAGWNPKALLVGLLVL